MSSVGGEDGKRAMYFAERPTDLDKSERTTLEERRELDAAAPHAPGLHTFEMMLDYATRACAALWLPVFVRPRRAARLEPMSRIGAAADSRPGGSAPATDSLATPDERPKGRSSST